MTPKESIESVLLETFRDADGHTEQVRLEAPLTVAEIQVFQQDQPAPLPDDIQELLRFNRGFTLLGECVDFLGTNRSEFEPSFPCGIPLHSDGFGNFWIAHTDPSTGAWAPILFVSYDPAVLVIQSADLVNFLEDFFTAFRPGPANALNQIYQIAFDIWRLDQGLSKVVEVRASPEEAIRAFVKGLKDEDYIADLRGRIIGSGFSWARFGADALVERDPCDLFFAVITPRQRGCLSRLFQGR